MNEENGNTFEDPSISALYKEASREQPPARLDEQILSLAQRETKKQLRPVSPFSGKWQITASLAAILVIAFGLVTFIDMEAPEEMESLSAPEQNIRLDEDISSITASKPEQADAVTQEQTTVAPTRQAEATRQETAPLAFQGKDSEPREEKIVVKKKARLKPAPEEQAQRSPESAVSKSVAPEPAVSESMAPAPSMAASPAPTAGLSQRTAPSATEAQREQVRPRALVESELADRGTARASKQENISAPAKQHEEKSAAVEEKRTIGRAAPIPKPIPHRPTMKSGIAALTKDVTTPQTLAGKPCGALYSKIEAIDYWRNHFRNNITSQREIKNTVCLTVFAGTGLEHYFIDKAIVADNDIRLDAYTHIIESAIIALKRDASTEEEARAQLKLLDRIVQPGFDNKADWIAWFDESRGSLKLNAAGDHIVRE